MQSPATKIFQEVAKVIKTPNLHNAYTAKRNSLVNDLKDSQNSVVKEKIYLSIIATDVCMQVYMSYLTIMVEVIQKLGQQQIAQNESDKKANDFMLKRAEESVSAFTDAISTDTDESLLGFLKNNAEINIGVWEHRNETSKTILELNLLQSEMYSTSILYAYSSVLEFMKSNDSKTAMEALEIFAKFLFGLLPGVGSLITAYELLETLKEKRKRINTISDTLNNWDDYFFATYNWCIFMQIMIDHLNSFVKGGKPVLDSSGEPNQMALDLAKAKTEERFTDVTEKMNKLIKQSRMSNNTSA